MIRIIVLSSFCLGALADTAVLGFPTCQCLGKNNLGLTKTNCTYDWQDDEGRCTITSPNATQFLYYPGTYGESCQPHLEPGDPKCFDVNATPPVAKRQAEQAGYCNDPWCYIDPCACDVKATPSSFFQVEPALTYSYATCKAKNTFVAESDNADTTIEVGEAACVRDGTGSSGSGAASPTTASPTEADNANTLTVGLGIMLVGVALALA